MLTSLPGRRKTKYSGDQFEFDTKHIKQACKFTLFESINHLYKEINQDGRQFNNIEEKDVFSFLQQYRLHEKTTERSQHVFQLGQGKSLKNMAR